MRSAASTPRRRYLFLRLRAFATYSAAGLHSPLSPPHPVPPPSSVVGALARHLLELGVPVERVRALAGQMLVLGPRILAVKRAECLRIHMETRRLYNVTLTRRSSIDASNIRLAAAKGVVAAPGAEIEYLIPIPDGAPEEVILEAAERIHRLGDTESLFSVAAARILHDEPQTGGSSYPAFSRLEDLEGWLGHPWMAVEGGRRGVRPPDGAFSIPSRGGSWEQLPPPTTLLGRLALHGAALLGWPLDPMNGHVEAREAEAVMDAAKRILTEMEMPPDLVDDLLSARSFGEVQSIARKRVKRVGDRAPRWKRLVPILVADNREFARGRILSRKLELQYENLGLAVALATLYLREVMGAVGPLWKVGLPMWANPENVPLTGRLMEGLASAPSLDPGDPLFPVILAASLSSDGFFPGGTVMILWPSFSNNRIAGIGKSVVVHIPEMTAYQARGILDNLRELMALRLDERVAVLRAMEEGLDATAYAVARGSPRLAKLLYRLSRKERMALKPKRIPAEKGGPPAEAVRGHTREVVRVAAEIAARRHPELVVAARAAAALHDVGKLCPIYSSEHQYCHEHFSAFAANAVLDPGWEFRDSVIFAVRNHMLALGASSRRGRCSWVPFAYPRYHGLLTRLAEDFLSEMAPGAPRRKPASAGEAMLLPEGAGRHGPALLRILREADREAKLTRGSTPR